MKVKKLNHFLVDFVRIFSPIVTLRFAVSAGMYEQKPPEVNHWFPSCAENLNVYSLPGGLGTNKAIRHEDRNRVRSNNREESGEKKKKRKRKKKNEKKITVNLFMICIPTA